MLVLVAAVFIASAAITYVQTPEPEFIATATPTEHAYAYSTELSDLTYVQDWPAEPTATPSPVPTPEPTLAPPSPAPVRAAEVRPSGFYWDNDPACMARADRYDWQTYALAAGFPSEVVYGDEMRELVRAESGFDLCAVNDSSGATCWIQQYYGGPEFLDPVTCMSQGYSKWLDGGGSFQRHWYNHW